MYSSFSLRLLLLPKLWTLWYLVVAGTIVSAMRCVQVSSLAAGLTVHGNKMMFNEGHRRSVQGTQEWRWSAVV